MMGSASRPFKDEALLVTRIVGPSVEIFIEVISVQPVIKPTTQCALGRFLETVKSLFGVNPFLVSTFQERETAAIVGT